jgi:hypothetical protein
VLVEESIVDLFRLREGSDQVADGKAWNSHFVVVGA